MAQITIESALQSGLVTLLSAVTWPAANATVIGYGDGEGRPKDPAMIVHAKPARRLEPNANYWECQVLVVCLTKPEADDNRVTVTRAYEEALGWVKGLTAASLTAATGLTVDGVIMTEAGEDSVTEDDQMKTVPFTVFITKA